MMKHLKIIYPNAKFVTLIYYDYFSQKNEFDLRAMENLGIKVVELNEISKNDFSKEKYRTSNSHPNRKAWQEIVPLLGKKLDL